MMERISKEPTTWTHIIEWQKKHFRLFPSNPKAHAWWKDVLENFEIGKEEVVEGVFIMRYKDEDLLDYLNQQLIIETAPSFSQKVDNYEKFLTSKKSEFPGNGRE